MKRNSADVNQAEQAPNGVSCPQEVNAAAWSTNWAMLVVISS